MIKKDKAKEFYKKDRKVLDTEVSIKTLLSHIAINFSYAFISGLLLAIIPTYNYLYIGLVYLIYKLVEGVVFKRGGYKSKLGNNVIYPFPSVLGFLSGVYVSEIIKNIL